MADIDENDAGTNPTDDGLDTAESNPIDAVEDTKVDDENKTKKYQQNMNNNSAQTQKQSETNKNTQSNSNNKNNSNNINEKPETGVSDNDDLPNNIDSSPPRKCNCIYWMVALLIAFSAVIAAFVGLVYNNIPVFKCPSDVMTHGIATEHDIFVIKAIPDNIDNSVVRLYEWRTVDYDVGGKTINIKDTDTSTLSLTFQEFMNGYVDIELSSYITLFDLLYFLYPHEYLKYIKYNFNISKTVCRVKIYVTDRIRPKPIQFHCPKSIYYVPKDTEQSLEANHKSHPSNTIYLWDIIKSKINVFGDEIFMIDGENTNTLKLPRFDTTGTIDFKLKMSAVLKQIYTYDRECYVKVFVHEKPIFGIDLGTTYSCISYQTSAKNYKNRRDITIVTADKITDEKCIPSAVYFQKNGKIIVGEEALNKLNFDPANVIFDIKRIVGRSPNDPEIKKFNSTHVFKIEDDNQSIFIPNLKQSILFEQVLAVILSHLVEIASFEWNIPYVRDAVVSIPALFHNDQRKAIRNSCYLAALDPVKLKLVVEPTAASLAHSYYHTVSPDLLRRFLAFDFGGGTLDCSVMSCTGLYCTVLSISGNSTLGGIDFDNVIKDIIIRKFQKQYKWFSDDNISDEQNSKILSIAETVKKQLSTVNAYKVTLTNDDGNKEQVTITRAEFENHSITKELIKSALELVDEAVNNQFDKGNIKMILMIGGTSNVPIVQKSIKEKFRDIPLEFPNSNEINSDPQLMVVTGAGIIGGSVAFLDGGAEDTKDKDIHLQDVIPLPIGIEECKWNEINKDFECGMMKVIIPKNQEYPTKKQEIVCQEPADATFHNFIIYEGGNERVKDNHQLKSVVLYGIPERGEDCDNIILELSVDRDGILNVTAKTNVKYGPVHAYDISVALDFESNSILKSIETLQHFREKMAKWYDFSKHELIKQTFSNTAKLLEH